MMDNPSRDVIGWDIAERLNHPPLPAVTLCLKEIDVAEALDKHDYSSLEPIEMPVTLPGGKRYILREATADGARAFNNAKAKLPKFSDGKIVGVGDAGDLEALLVSKCLYEPDKDGRLRLDANGNPDPRWQVREGIVRTWLSRIIHPLYLDARRISGLEDEDTEESLQAQLEVIQAKLAALREKNGVAPKHSGGDEDPDRITSSQEDEGQEGNGRHGGEVHQAG